MVDPIAQKNARASAAAAEKAERAAASPVSDVALVHEARSGGMKPPGRMSRAWGWTKSKFSSSDKMKKKEPNYKEALEMAYESDSVADKFFEHTLGKKLVENIANIIGEDSDAPEFVNTIKNSVLSDDVKDSLLENLENAQKETYELTGNDTSNIVAALLGQLHFKSDIETEQKTMAHYMAVPEVKPGEKPKGSIAARTRKKVFDALVADPSEGRPYPEAFDREETEFLLACVKSSRLSAFVAGEIAVLEDVKEANDILKGMMYKFGTAFIQVKEKNEGIIADGFARAWGSSVTHGMLELLTQVYGASSASHFESNLRSALSTQEREGGDYKKENDVILNTLNASKGSALAEAAKLNVESIESALANIRAALIGIDNLSPDKLKSIFAADKASRISERLGTSGKEFLASFDARKLSPEQKEAVEKTIIEISKEGIRAALTTYDAFLGTFGMEELSKTKTAIGLLDEFMQEAHTLKPSSIKADYKENQISISDAGTLGKSRENYNTFVKGNLKMETLKLNAMYVETAEKYLELHSVKNALSFIRKYPYYRNAFVEGEAMVAAIVKGHEKDPFNFKSSWRYYVNGEGRTWRRYKRATVFDQESKKRRTILPYWETNAGNQFVKHLAVIGLLAFGGYKLYQNNTHKTLYETEMRTSTEQLINESDVYKVAKKHNEALVNKLMKSKKYNDSYPEMYYLVTRGYLEHLARDSVLGKPGAKEKLTEILGEFSEKIKTDEKLRNAVKEEGVRRLTESFGANYGGLRESVYGDATMISPEDVKKTERVLQDYETAVAENIVHYDLRKIKMYGEFDDNLHEKTDGKTKMTDAEKEQKKKESISALEQRFEQIRAKELADIAAKAAAAPVPEETAKAATATPKDTAKTKDSAQKLPSLDQVMKALEITSNSLAKFIVEHPEFWDFRYITLEVKESFEQTKVLGKLESKKEDESYIARSLLLYHAVHSKRNHYRQVDLEKKVKMFNRTLIASYLDVAGSRQSALLGEPDNAAVQLAMMSGFDPKLLQAKPSEIVAVEVNPEKFKNQISGEWKKYLESNIVASAMVDRLITHEVIGLTESAAKNPNAIVEYIKRYAEATGKPFENIFNVETKEFTDTDFLAYLQGKGVPKLPQGKSLEAPKQPLVGAKSKSDDVKFEKLLNDLSDQIVVEAKKLEQKAEPPKKEAAPAKVEKPKKQKKQKKQNDGNPFQ